MFSHALSFSCNTFVLSQSTMARLDMFLGAPYIQAYIQTTSHSIRVSPWIKSWAAGPVPEARADLQQASRRPTADNNNIAPPPPPPMDSPPPHPPECTTPPPPRGFLGCLVQLIPSHGSHCFLAHP